MTRLPFHLEHLKKKVPPRARARARVEGEGSNRRRMNEEEKNEEKEAFSSLCFGNGREESKSLITSCVIHRLLKEGIFFPLIVSTCSSKVQMSLLIFEVEIEKQFSFYILILLLLSHDISILLLYSYFYFTFFPLFILSFCLAPFQLTKCRSHAWMW